MTFCAFCGKQTVFTYALLLLLLGWSHNAFAQKDDPLRLPLQKGHTLNVGEVKWSPSDKLLLTYSAADGYLHVWQMPEAKLITTIEDTTVRRKGSDKRVLRAFSWSDDSRLIATGNENGTAQLWEAQTGKLVWTTQIADEYVTGVSFSRDSKSVVDAYGRPVSDGLHIAAISMLPPKTTVLFSVPKALIRDGRAIRVNYTFLNEDDNGKLVDYGKQRTLKLSQGQLAGSRGNR